MLNIKCIVTLYLLRFVCLKFATELLQLNIFNSNDFENFLLPTNSPIFGRNFKIRSAKNPKKKHKIFYKF